MNTNTAAALPRNEYPRPQFVRADWTNLNGAWEFVFDDDNIGEKEKWYVPGKQVFDRSITVPFCFQSDLSGIGEKGFHDNIWYRRQFQSPANGPEQRVILHFGAVDYTAKVWINGELATRHEGGHVSFQADITDLLIPGDNTIVVKAEDDSRDIALPRGKQYWKEKPRGIWYTGTTGIWQTVWLEAVAATYLEKVKLTPDVDLDEVRVRAFVKGLRPGANVYLNIHVTFNGESVAEDRIRVKNGEETRSIRLGNFNEHGMGRLWTPEKPQLFDIRFTLEQDGQELDRVDSYFGLRKISIENGLVCLNNRPYKMRLVLDQGYFPDGLLTAPSDEALKKDVELTKEMGFNGSRKHQKVEDPRFMYWCDRLGLLLWGEMANAYDYSEAYSYKMTREWQEVIDRDYNHPCIVAWVPLNESWGVPNIQIDVRQQQHALAMYHLTKSLDSTRLVVSNDGWEHMKTDLCTIHDYAWQEEVLTERYATAQSAVESMPARRRIFVGDVTYNGEPILVTEFGGIAFKKSDWEGWGYSGAENDEDFLKRLGAVVRPMRKSSAVQGFCYTQLTDVEQEINGLLTYDRKPKVDLKLIKEIIQG